MRTFLIASSVIALLALSGCGSESSSPTPPSGGNDPPVITPPDNTPVEGIATPSSVAVVTATNAQ